MELIIYTDGASRGNPGNAAYGFTVSDKKGKLIYQEGRYIGFSTNNVAEYTGVLRALTYVERNISETSLVEVFADSRLIVEQLSGNFKIKNVSLKKIYQQIKNLEKGIGIITYTHIYREKNQKADELANQALDDFLR